MNSLFSEIKSTALSLSRVPGFVVTTVFTLALTLGVLLAAFSLNHLLIFKALPYPDAERLILMNQEIQQGELVYKNSQLFVAQKYMYRKQKSLASMALVYRNQSVLSSHNEKPLTDVSYISPEYIEVLATPMLIGRGFDQQEQIDRHQPSAMISEKFWKKRFASDGDILSKSLTFGNQQYRIVGVISDSFIEPNLFNDEGASQVWLPWDFHAQDADSWNNAYSSTAAIGKLLANTSKEEVSDEFNLLIDPLFQQNGRVGKDKHQALVASFKDLQVAIIGDNKYIGLLVLLGAGVLLLIACANIVNLFFSRAAQRQRALVIQATLGAKLKHLFFSIWLESFLLCGASMLIGLVIAGWSIKLLRNTAGSVLPRLSELSLDWTAVAFAGLLTIILSLIFAVITLKLINYKQLISQLQSSGKGTGAQVNSKVRNLLVSSQICLATLLLLVTSLIMNNVLSVLNQPLGFEDKALYSVRLDIGDAYPEKADKMQLSRDLMAELKNIAGVKQVSRAINPPIRRGNSSTSITDSAGIALGQFPYITIDTQYFDTVGLKVLAGRGFTMQEVRNDEDPIILSQTAARKIAGDKDIVGTVIYSGGGTAYKVIGIVEDVYNPYLSQDVQGVMMYLTFSAYKTNFLVRMETGKVLDKMTVLNLVDDKFPDLKVWNFTSVSDIYSDLVYHKKLTLWLSLTLAIFALLLAAVGIYGVISYNSQMRRYELGIRMALGAKSRHIMTDFIKESFTPIIAGFVVSLLLSVMLYGWAQQYINEWLTIDWLMTVGCIVTLMVIALAACYFPAKRIIASDPIQALRNE
jgi:predicted permease